MQTRALSLMLFGGYPRHLPDELRPAGSPSCEWTGDGKIAGEPVASDHRSKQLSCDFWLYLGKPLRLSERELQIVQGIFDDQEQEILACSLGIPTDLVYRTLQRIYLKLRVGSRAELIVRVMAEYLAFVADQGQPEISGPAYWPVKVGRMAAD